MLPVANKQVYAFPRSIFNPVPSLQSLASFACFFLCLGMAWRPTTLSLPRTSIRPCEKTIASCYFPVGHTGPRAVAWFLCACVEYSPSHGCTVSDDYNRLGCGGDCRPSLRWHFPPSCSFCSYDDLVDGHKVEYIAGGATQNSIRVAQVCLHSFRWYTSLASMQFDLPCVRVYMYSAYRL